jgi:hypothetical protein
MNWNDFTARRIRVEYANLAKVNKIRAWARRNNATVQVSRYARDAYDGYVKIAAPWNEGAAETDRKEQELRTLLAA